MLLYRFLFIVLKTSTDQKLQNVIQMQEKTKLLCLYKPREVLAHNFSNMSASPADFYCYFVANQVVVSKAFVFCNICSVRHNLTTLDCFQQGDKAPVRGSYWSIKPKFMVSRGLRWYVCWR